MRLSDTVRVYLRNFSSPYNIVDSSKGIINKNSLNGKFIMKKAPTGSYYLSVKHRNSIETWSHVPLGYNCGDSLNYTFITSAVQAFGNNMKS